METIQPKNSYTNVADIERVMSVAAGTALALKSVKKGAWAIPGLLAAGVLVHRGITGRCEAYRAFGVRTSRRTATLPYELGVRARAAVTIARSRQEVYEFWSQLENLPRFMKHLVEVETREGGRSHWVARGPMDRPVAWEAEIINSIPGELLAWKSLPGSDVDHAGSVRFMDAPGGRGTEVRVELQYNPPAGIVGAYVARLFGREPEQEIRSDLGRLKQMLEAGETATVEGQPQGSTHPAQQKYRSRSSEELAEEVTA